MESLPNKTNKSEENSCAICLLMVCEPIKLPCSHIFCKYCLEKMKENDINNFFCPLCRMMIPLLFKFIVNKILENEYLSNNKENYQKRIDEIDSYRVVDGFFEKVKLFYGNYHEIVENKENNNHHQWKFFFKGEIKSKWKMKDLIKKVEVQLDPNFGGAPIILRDQPFELNRSGFDEFTLVFKIYWQKWLKMEPVSVEHHLNFDKSITKMAYILKFKKDIHKPIFNKI